MQVRDLTIQYGNRIILEHISLDIPKGDFVFLIGASGSGKTSLVNALIGSVIPKSGEIISENGKQISLLSKTSLQDYRRTVGVIFQDYKLLPRKTVEENVSFALEVSGYANREIQERLSVVLTKVGLIHKRNAFVEELSGWEQQRVAIARALIHDPQTIIADEPTGNLDPENALDVMSLLEELHRQGKTLIVATHDDRIVDRMKKRVIAFGNGWVLFDRIGGYATK
jgi:cell division transport system ATP-binding protein